MQIQRIQSTQNFQGHAARNIGQVMTRLYDSAYGKMTLGTAPNIIQVSARMKDGTDVTAVANFYQGEFLDIAFAPNHHKYKKEFCSNILRKFNDVVTKGKCNKK